MAINKNHLFEDLDGVKCAIVELNVDEKRAEFLKSLLESNGYNVIIVNSPPPKVAIPDAPPAHATYTVGVTDVTFNATNAIFGRLLHTPEGRVVTLSYWKQADKISEDTIPYFQNYTIHTR